MKEAYSSLTQLLVDVQKDTPTKIDFAYSLVGQIKQFKDPNSITLEEIETIRNGIINGDSSRRNSKDIERGQQFYNSTLNSYIRFTSRDGTLSNNKANSLRRKEKKTLQRLLQTGEN
ncbi:MAG: hypothetical protein LAT82_02800 [Nanoarchaeota archaeon]|nr:hypothetical protein [Nanoarchaeota archaeon]